jgi:hypothetical protein
LRRTREPVITATLAGTEMNALFQFFTAMVVAIAAMAFSHFGVAAEGLEFRSSPQNAERSVKRSQIVAPSLQQVQPQG